MAREVNNFDPTHVSNGEIHKYYRWRLGVLYSTTSAAISRGEVLFEATVRYA